MKKQFLTLCLAMLASVVIAGCGGSDENNDGGGNAGNGTLYIFGDSLSDTGNVGRAASFGEDLPAPYYQNRISNGPVIVDYVAQSLGQELAASDYRSSQERGTNYAVAGARASSDGIDLDLDAQVNSFLTKNNFSVDANHIYLFFIGGNDILDVSDAGTQATLPLDDAAQEVASNMRRLAALGARKFIVLNAPDIGKTPKVIERESTMGGGIAAAATASSTYYNNKLSEELQANRAIGVQSDLIDIQQIVNNIIANAAASGFTNTTQGCYIREQFQFASFCSDAQLDSFVFFDDVHPSGKMHQLVGEEVARQVGTILN
jgi:phospholipase/lecithinase/hemolysin